MSTAEQDITECLAPPLALEGVRLKKTAGKKMGKIAVHVRFFAYFCDINSIPHTIDAGIGYLSGADKSNKGRKR